MTALYHGGIAGLGIGDILKPSPPHVTDGCPICLARAAGSICTVGEYREWARGFGTRGLPVLALLEDVADYLPIDPPSAEHAVYITRNIEYASWYAARSGHGDLYRVAPIGPMRRTIEDHFESYTVAEARITQVITRGVHLTRKQRRELQRLWLKADQAAS